MKFYRGLDNIYPCIYLKQDLLSALAMDLATLVLPTPGGPAKQMILPCVEPFSWDTAINSRIRFFTSSRPQWSVSSTSLQHRGIYFRRKSHLIDPSICFSLNDLSIKQILRIKLFTTLYKIYIPGHGQLEVLLTGDAPGDGGQPVQVVPRHVELARVTLVDRTVNRHIESRCFEIKSRLERIQTKRVVS